MKRTAWKRFFAAFFAAVCLPVSSLYVQAAEPAAEQARVSAEVSGNTVTIGNEYINREFSIAGGKLSTEKITNKRTEDKETVFVPAEGSEEFKIRMAKTVSSIDRSGWTAAADSYQNETGASDGNASNLIDGDTSSIWHSKYDDSGINGKGSTAFPYNVTFQLGKSTTFQCFSYTPRTSAQGVNTNGNLKDYELYYSTGSEELAIDSSEWRLLKKGTFTYDGANPIYVNLDQPCTATQLKLKAISAMNGKNFGGGAEFNLHEQQVIFSDAEREFSAGDLTLAGAPKIENTTATINQVEKSGKKVTFTFQPFQFKNIDFTINEVIVMYDGDHFMRKYMEISVPEDQREDAVIDYIDLESMAVNSSDAVWTIPTDAGGVVQMEQFRANLGQPVYIQGMFFGCEFPAADNEIADGVGYMRYYTGKSFNRLKADNQLTQDGKYVTWQTVAGAARSTENEVIQADFFEYIKSIATPSEFRIQYNSWFDNMMLISDDNILKSFIEIDRELNQAEVRPLDSYVVDDGWVNYNDTSVLDADRCGTTLNQTGFWEFNSKFPKGLTPSSELVHNFGSNFGVWVGPRGGYNFYGSLADILTKAGTGSKAGGSIDVADRTYVKNFTNMAVKWMKDYGVNYWKWDGFADNGQYHAFAAQDGVPGYANRHMTGGYQHMYHVTDLWEAWIDLMETVRQCEKDNDINHLWISLTCYVNPSPWYLQWANSVWIQCIHDQSDAGPSQSKMDRQITYRDAVYYDFIKNHEFQFPLSNLYNHDPIYGVEGTGMNKKTATDEQFKNYLYMLATRGTAFWELYFSDSIMTDGKYEVTAEFLEWAEENYHMLKNSKMFGNSPDSNVKLNSVSEGITDAYGYSCFDGTDGIISFRNPSNTVKTVTVTFDRTLGVPENAGVLKYHIEHSHNLTANTPAAGTLTYGQEISYTLQPDEVRILRVSKNGDAAAPQIARAYSDGKNGITVKFNEKVTAGTFKINGSAATAEASADGRSFHLATADTASMEDNSRVTVTAEGVRDLAGNPFADNTVSFLYHKDNTLLNTAEILNGKKTVQAAEDSLVGNNGFSVMAQVYTESAGAVLAQGGEYEIGINENGTAYFKLNGVTAASKTVVNDKEGHTITGVKENNGMLKIYVDGQLEGAGYQEENRYYQVKAADITVGNENFEGVVTAKVSDIAIGYDTVAKQYGSSQEAPAGEQNWALGKTVCAKWTSDNSDAENNGDMPVSNAVDGNKGTLSYGEFGADNQDASSYLQVDLEEVKSISKIHLYRYFQDNRTYAGTVIALSETEDFANKMIVYNSDRENFHGLGAGTDQTYAETSEGRSFEFKTAVDARYVRVYMHGRNANATTNHVVELEVIGKEEVGSADYAAVDSAIHLASALDKEDYFGFDVLESAIAAVVRGKDATEQAAVNKMAGDILKAIAGLEKTELKREAAALIAQTEAAYQDSSKYTVESWKTLEDALKNIKDVQGNPASTKEQYEEAQTSLKKAVSNLVEAGGEEPTPPGPDDPTPPGPDDPTPPGPDDPTPPGPENPAQPIILEGKTYKAGSYKYKVISLAKRTVEVTGAVDKNLKKITVSDTVKLGGKSFKITSVKASAFKSMKKATSAVIGKNVGKIGKSAFEKCSALKSVTIKSASLTQIGAKTFANCKKLEKITIKSKKLKKIESSTFEKCEKLKAITISSTALKQIDSKAFANCKKLSKITIKSKKLSKVGKNAFKGISKKAVIKVPSSKVKAYRKLFAKKGQSKSVKIKK